MSAVGNRELPADERALCAEIVRRIVAATDPEKIILFGSRARGDHRPDSDFDILVVKETAEPRYTRSRALYSALADLWVEVDISVYTPQEIAAWREVRQAFTTTATREGKVIYERAA